MKIPFLNRLQALSSSPRPTMHPVLQPRATALVESIREALPGLLSILVVHMETGQSLASYTNVPGLDPTKAAPFAAELVRQKRLALQAMALVNEKIQDILVTLREQLHLLYITQDEQLLLVLTVSSHDTNLAIARHILQSSST